MMKGVRILCALALLFVSFAHKVPMLNEASIQPIEVSQYVFPDGTQHVLCLTDEAGNGEHDHWDLGSPCRCWMNCGSSF
ncbi:MAG: hypothetical protein M9945_17365 [Aquamicrobium sp.]|uniref:hypothetical protein n=1 Tax=Aquamicrobium sp. TaxID=1872579 RepID=UPI00349EC2FE|nr:hypothetical protein [Aquamicrobium sp.]